MDRSSVNYCFHMIINSDNAGMNCKTFHVWEHHVCMQEWSPFIGENYNPKEWKQMSKILML